MKNDLEQLLSKVGTPTGRAHLGFSLFNRILNRFNNRQFKIKFLKITGVVIISVFAAWFFAGINSRPLKIQQPDNVRTDNEIVNQVSKIIVLPDEIPAIATITKEEMLKSKTFFKGAKNGDQVLIFKNADKAILFSQTENKILNIGKIKETEVDFELDE